MPIEERRLCVCVRQDKSDRLSTAKWIQNSKRILRRPSYGREISSSMFGQTRRTKLYLKAIFCNLSLQNPPSIFQIPIVTKIFGQFEFRWLTVAVSSKLAGRPCQGHLCNLTSHPHQQNVIKIDLLSQYYKICIKMLSLLSGSSLQLSHQQNIVISSPDSSSAHQHYQCIKSSHHIFWFVLIISTWISCPTHPVHSRHNGTIVVLAHVMVLARVLFCPPRLLFS